MDEILKKRGLKYDDLSYTERQSLADIVASSQTRPLTVGDIRKSIKVMRGAVERELVETDEFIYFLFFKRVNRKQILLKARLQNLLIIETFLGDGETPPNNPALVAQTSGIIG